ncbi:hypothetical protein FJV46_13015 [Arthrobacter agilis]|uniref:MaoC family dehydratase n=1 Tax=Arthrobacter agilis TaxID=37921 RepID=UPI000B3505ED|nr:MaoC/PaaZ C-terminal domain-containing protein [Arthrobacter agilis]PPB47396.1 hypothetical protein CI784_02225 [Arthrobacter agilis]TPV22813.1 hypothetical protein FJV46_13015 [Arthrobacter agilis]VDR32063.1 (3R)-hydroxyacyl-ACP dehydratase subunit HadB [Arthrobacter agilis]
MSGDAAGLVQLTDVPDLGGLYRRAIGLALRRRVTRRTVPPTLPDARHGVTGVRVDLADLTRFQQFLGSAVLDRVPSAYLHTIAFPVAMSVLARPDFPMPLLGLVHLRNEVHQDRQVGASELLDVVAWSEDLRPHAAGAQFDLVTEISVGGHRVWCGRSVYLARGIRLEPSHSRPAGEDRPAFVPPVRTGVWRLDAATGRHYAAVSGDWNPIHLSGPSARALGMKGAIAHGMYLAARMVDEAVPAPTGALSWRIDFATPVLLPGSVTTAFLAVPGGMDGGGLDGGGAAGPRTDVVGWDAKRRRPHFTGWVRAE